MEISKIIMDGIKLTPIKISDHEKLFYLIQKVYKEAYQHFWIDQGNWYVDLCYNQDNLQKELSRSRSHYFFIESNGKSVGILKYDYPFSPREIEIPNALKLHRLYLDQSVHGKGIAQKLLTHVEKIAQENGIDYIWLEAMIQKPQAKRFYEKMGFKEVLTYQLEFERLIPEFRGIQIMKKNVNRIT
ncbi:GNAT family N-acetyltransferase [Algoriphagus lutimaris]|uniref:GNAT family N-acetyltransferase n=1 Tax=Algoriphagus lutimaris TaxID=613197 RepID=UPI00196B8404|nr:GNAT family N-acetyltransferase [Algoriphagus lutimaris]MBN3519565.1 GNAT family N-acetyltransferase [Algoriphagus lutimaris]